MNARHKGVGKMWLLNLFGNAALLAGVYGFLVLPDAHGWQVGGSALLALVVIFFGLWLRTGSFAYFRVGAFRDNGLVGSAFRRALRHLIALLIWAIPLAVLEWLLYSCLKYAPQFGVWWWQKVPALRIGSPRTVFHAAQWLIWIVMALLIALWLPTASTVAAVGFRGTHIARSCRLLGRLSYWLWFYVLAFVGIYVPYKLVWWIPELNSLRTQAWSAGLRLAVAWTILVSAWVALLLVIGDRLTVLDPLQVDGVSGSETLSRQRIP